MKIIHLLLLVMLILPLASCSENASIGDVLGNLFATSEVSDIEGDEDEEDEEGNKKIFRLEIFHSTQDKISADVTYDYKQDCGKEGLLEITTMLDQESMGLGEQIAMPLKKGVNSWIINFTMNQYTPDQYFSNKLKLKWSSKKCGAFDEKIFPFKKHWQRSS